MIQVIAHMTVAPGKGKQAMEFIENHRTIHGVDVQWMTAVTPGSGETGYWHVQTFESLAEWAEYQQKLFDDPNRGKRLSEWRSCFVPSAFTRTIYRTV